MFSIFNSVHLLLMRLVFYFFIFKMSEKRKASMDNVMQQPPLKKLATESPMGVTLANSLPVDMPGSSSGYPTIIGTADSNLQSSRNENVPESSGRKEMVSGQGPSTSAALTQAWKDDVDVGHLLPSLYEYFGESMLSFVPSPAASFFLWSLDIGHTEEIVPRHWKCSLSLSRAQCLGLFF